VHSGEGNELVWLSKQDELVDSGWFSQAVPDLIIVMQGQHRVEFEAAEVEDRILQPGDVLVLPAGMKCRAYRWPRDVRQATVFVAAYPTAPAA
jgi:uncharacterized protein YjlB